MTRKDDSDDVVFSSGYAATDDVSENAKMESSGPAFRIKPGGGKVSTRS
jgi:hypothetical protein